MENKKRKNRKNALFAVLFAVVCSNMILTHALDTMRAVAILQIFAGGILFGLLVNGVMESLRSQTEQNN